MHYEQSVHRGFQDIGCWIYVSVVAWRCYEYLSSISTDSNMPINRYFLDCSRLIHMLFPLFHYFRVSFSLRKATAGCYLCNTYIIEYIKIRTLAIDSLSISINIKTWMRSNTYFKNSYIKGFYSKILLSKLYLNKFWTDLDLDLIIKIIGN